MSLCRDRHGGSQPSPDMAAAIHENSFEHVKIVPKMQWTIAYHEMTSAKIGTDVETYEGSFYQLQNIMEKDRNEFHVDCRRRILIKGGKV
eukprot:1442572-Pyramimonas_sp.AAC.1